MVKDVYIDFVPFGTADDDSTLAGALVAYRSDPDDSWVILASGYCDSGCDAKVGGSRIDVPVEHVDRVIKAMRRARAELDMATVCPLVDSLTSDC